MPSVQICFFAFVFCHNYQLLPQSLCICSPSPRPRCKCHTYHLFFLSPDFPLRVIFTHEDFAQVKAGIDPTASEFGKLFSRGALNFRTRGVTPKDGGQQQQGQPNQQQNQQMRLPYVPPADRVCFSCNKTGHMMKDCPLKKEPR